MNLKNLFKKLVLFNLIITLFIIGSAFTNMSSEEVISFNNSVPPNIVIGILILVWFVALFINTYMLYTFKKYGKPLFLILFVAAILLILLGGPIAFDPIIYVLDSLSMAITGAILYILYFTQIKKEFE